MADQAESDPPIDPRGADGQTENAATDARLDATLAARGLARSRTHAAHLITDGLVTVDGRGVVKPSFRVSVSSTVEVAPSDHYVSRAAGKLIAALDGFSIPVAGRVALDVGASTGGFSQVLVERGIGTVIALDVGHGQLAPTVRSDPHVVVLEGVNARNLTRDALRELSGVAVVPDLVVADLSFISLITVLPALRASVDDRADFVLLVKPQFEVGRERIREGVVRDAGLRADAVTGVLWAGWDLGLRTAGVLPSPVIGSGGNHEYLVWMTSDGGSDPSQWSDEVIAMAKSD